MITPARLRAVRAATGFMPMSRTVANSVKLAPRLLAQRARWNSTLNSASVPPADESEAEKIRPFVDTRSAKAHHGEHIYQAGFNCEKR